MQFKKITFKSNKHINKCSISLVTKMQIKVPLAITVIKTKKMIIPSVGEDVNKQILIYSR